MRIYFDLSTDLGKSNDKVRPEMSHSGLESLPFISETAVASVLEWEPLIDVLEQAMVDFSAGNVTQPLRQMVPVPEHDAIIATMLAIGEAMAVKVVTLYHENADTELPTHQAVILVFNKHNGTPLAIVDGRLITEMRTAASTAAVVRKLATPHPDVVTILGSGVQARAHAQALSVVRSWRELRISARNKDNGQALADELGAVFVADADTAVHDADIVVCATSATQPILRGEWLKSGVLLISVGWNTPDGRELDDVAMSNIVIVESIEAAMNQSGDVRGSGCDIYAEIGEIYSGVKKVPTGQTLVFDSVGIAIMDVAAAKLVYDLVHAG